MLGRFIRSDEWKFFFALPKADPRLAVLWWALILLRGILPAAFAITVGVLVGAVNNGDSLALPLTVAGVVFVVLQMLTPLHVAVSANVGSKTAAWLNDRLMEACLEPPGMAHLERPELTDDLTMARDFDLGISGPPLSISMDFIATGLVELASGLAAAAVLARYHWWAPLLVGAAWASTHVLLRESSVWRDRNTPEVLEAQRHADYAYRLAVDPPAAKEIRLFGLAGWTIDRFVSASGCLSAALSPPAALRPAMECHAAARASGGVVSGDYRRCECGGVLVDRARRLVGQHQPGRGDRLRADGRRHQRAGGWRLQLGAGDGVAAGCGGAAPAGGDASGWQTDRGRPAAGG
jgi:hypothetical protein